tara:strand:+ start:290 stop:406 length:117 start_codon:yes stop_codon:yes gene_type:complete
MREKNSIDGKSDHDGDVAIGPNAASIRPISKSDLASGT